MTLLGAALDGDSVLVTADSVVTRSDGMGSAMYEGTTVKFRPVRESTTTKVLFGFYGEEFVGEPIASELDRSTAWPLGTNW